MNEPGPSDTSRLADRRRGSILVFIAVGLAFAAFPGEISNQVLVHRTFREFVITLANYVWYLALAYRVSDRMERHIGDPYWARLRYYLLYGFIGIAIEWFLLGVYPFVVSPVQLMLFSFWAGMAIVPCIFTDEPATENLRQIRRGITCYIFVWCCLSLGPFAVGKLLVPRLVEPARGFSILVYGLGVLGIQLPVFRYFRYLRSSSTAAELS